LLFTLFLLFKEIDRNVIKIMQNEGNNNSIKLLNEVDSLYPEVKSNQSKSSPLTIKKPDITFRVISKENSGNKLDETKDLKLKNVNAEFDISRKNTDDRTYDCNYN